jgi:hypothetical protein
MDITFTTMFVISLSAKRDSALASPFQKKKKKWVVIQKGDFNPVFVLLRS